MLFLNQSMEWRSIYSGNLQGFDSGVVGLGDTLLLAVELTLLFFSIGYCALNLRRLTLSCWNTSCHDYLRWWAVSFDRQWVDGVVWMLWIKL